MRKIGKLENKKSAEKLNNYLLSKEIDNIIKSTNEKEYVLWIEDEDKLTEAKKIFGEFIQNSEDPRYTSVIVDKSPKKKRAKKITLVLGPRYPYLTQVLILTSVIVTALFHSPELKEMRIPENVLLWRNPFNGYYWTLITPIFVHFGVLHLLFNMLALHHLGFLIEGKQGTIFYLTQVVVIAIISNVAEFVMSPSYFGGMSGVLYGQFGYLWIRGRLDKTRDWDIYLTDSVIKFAIIWFFLCWLVIPDIANYAHTGGLLSGMLWGYLAAQES
ncbi:rhomboid family intramembrane serine protease [Candidatus Uabimicrobium sp. HlEnr_7]|uniref:rhomboid family intramembrane serine protease n=1 Tax=Candidatus Uabimicrobium helgolandensis TaxID=3095367 RepID=UPI0035580554